MSQPLQQRLLLPLLQDERPLLLQQPVRRPRLQPPSMLLPVESLLLKPY
jgi:hypothetical protein